MIRARWLATCPLERIGLGLITRILLAIIDFLLELFRFFLADERKASKTILQFKGMEKGPVLIVVELLINFLVPDDAAI